MRDVDGVPKREKKELKRSFLACAQDASVLVNWGCKRELFSYFYSMLLFYGDEDDVDNVVN